MTSDVTLIERLYDRFNARDMEAVLAMLHPNVVWANGMEGGRIHGREGVGSYWTRQWAMIDPHVEPVGFASSPNGEIIVEVRQTVRDLAGALLSDKAVSHSFRLKDGLIRRFDIGATPSSAQSNSA